MGKDISVPHGICSKGDCHFWSERSVGSDIVGIHLVTLGASFLKKQWLYYVCTSYP